MLEYEEGRTEELVHRLIAISKILRFIIIIGFTLGFLCVFWFIYKESKIYVAIAMVLLGGVVGYLVGKYAAALITTIIEWCAQLLVGVENLVSLLKKK